MPSHQMRLARHIYFRLQICQNCPAGVRSPEVLHGTKRDAGMTQGRSALFVGINEYRDSEIPNLSAPRNDIDRIRSLLADPDIGGFDIEPLCLNETASEISRRIDHFFRMAVADKTLLLYFAGHGMRDDEGDLYLCANDTEHDALASTAVEARFIRERIRASPSNHIFVLLDCCYSGQFSRHFRGAENEEIRLDDQFLGPTAGISILSASGWLQQAFENPDYSLFTEALAEGLESGDADLDGDGLIDITELHRYMRDWFERVGKQQRPRLLHEEESPAPYFARAGRRNARRLFDSAMYEQVVLFPANGDSSRITKDIVKRYQLGGTSTELTSFWIMSGSAVKLRTSWPTGNNKPLSPIAL